MKKERIKGWLGLLGTLLILFYIGSVYRAGGFTAGFGLALFSGILAVPALFLASYRRVGTLPAWITAAAALPTLLWSTGDSATAVLAWVLFCGAPFAVTLTWPYFRKVGPLTSHALPMAAAFWMGGALVYSKLHFGSWNLYAMTARIAERYVAMIDEMELLYHRLYGPELPLQMGEAFGVLRSQSVAMGFYVIMMVAFGLMGAYFLGIWVADRAVKGSHWLGSWAVLIPGRGISWVYMLTYIAVQFIGGAQIATLLAVIYLFGFFFVFTGVYWLRGLMRKKQWPGVAQFLLIGLLLVLAYCTVGGSLLSPYTILLYLGWWIATMPRLTVQSE